MSGVYWKSLDGIISGVGHPQGSPIPSMTQSIDLASQITPHTPTAIPSTTSVAYHHCLSHAPLQQLPDFWDPSLCLPLLYIWPQHSLSAMLPHHLQNKNPNSLLALCTWCFRPRTLHTSPGSFLDLTQAIAQTQTYLSLQQPGGLELP